MSTFLDRVLLARAEEQAATATYRVRCVCCRVRQLDADESNGFDRFRFAGIPLDVSYDKTFEATCRWAAAQGLLSLEQVSAWQRDQKQQERERS